MANVEIYTLSWCGYCARAKALLKAKGVDYTEFDIEALAGKRAEMVARSGGRTTAPQIFINGKGIGGSDDLHALDAKGGLDPLLAEAAP